VTKVALVTGANGQLGGDVCEVFATRGWTVAPLTHAQLDLATAPEEAVSAAFAPHQPSIVVNCAAYTNVERAEDERERAFAINATAARRVAAAARAAGAYLIHISTDYVFDGAKHAPYVESDEPRPLQVYGESKLQGEREVAEAGGAWAVVRSSGLYGTRPCRGKGGANFVQTMLRLAREKDELKVVNDEIVTPTWTRDLAVQLERLADVRPPGIFHATPQGAVSWYDFAAAIFALAGVRVRLTPIAAASYASKAKRPPYSVLENARLDTLGLDVMPHWKDALRSYLVAAGAAG
jgi:dTDP-4-dehydrorhamnose reductase